MELEDLLARVPEGWTRVRYDGRTYGLTRTTHTEGRSVAVFAEELGGSDVVSANVYRTGDGLLLKPCEMPAATVLAFLVSWRPAPGTAARSGPGPGGCGRARRTGPVPGR